MPKIVTRESRTAETLRAAHDMREAIAKARRTDTEADWATAAQAAGQVQRKARQLAGLGRGG